MLSRALIAATIVTLALSAATARATSPGKNGRIAFMVKDSQGHWQTWVAGPRLEGAKQLTRGLADSGYAVWSPDGKKLAFDSNRADPNPKDSVAVNDIFTMNPEGSGVTKLTDSVGASADAAWSPDGALIAFDADRGDPNSKQGIYTMRSAGSGLRRVTVRPPGYEYDVSPRFSPDGKRLVFTRYRGKGCPQPYCPSEQAALFIVALDGTGLRQLTTFAIHAGDADWSPDGKRIVFEAYPHGLYGDVYVIGANGHNLRNLTRDPTGQADPVWSPDGTKILFLDFRRVDGIGRLGLATMRPNGTARSFVSSRNIEEHQPDWESAH